MNVEITLNFLYEFLLFFLLKFKLLESTIYLGNILSINRKL